MRVINFTNNWNNKLECQAFTTFRLRSDKYKVGRIYQLNLKGYSKGQAKIIQILHLTLDNVNEWIARMDTGYSLEEFKLIIQNMYKNKVDTQTAEFSLILLHKEKEVHHEA